MSKFKDEQNIKLLSITCPVHLKVHPSNSNTYAQLVVQTYILRTGVLVFIQKDFKSLTIIYAKIFSYLGIHLNFFRQFLTTKFYKINLSDIFFFS